MGRCRFITVGFVVAVGVQARLDLRQMKHETILFRA